MVAIPDEPTKPIKAGQKTREPETCPACRNRYGHAEEDETPEGIPLTRYWHTDLNDHRDYCEDRADGSAEQLRKQSDDPRNNERTIIPIHDRQ